MMIRHIFNFNALANGVWNTDTVYSSPVSSFSHSVPFMKGARFVSLIISITWWFFICVKFSRSTLDYRKNVSLVLCFYLLIYRNSHLLRNVYLSLIEVFLLFILSCCCCWFSFFAFILIQSSPASEWKNVQVWFSLCCLFNSRSSYVIEYL